MQEMDKFLKCLYHFEGKRYVLYMYVMYFEALDFNFHSFQEHFKRCYALQPSEKNFVF